MLLMPTDVTEAIDAVVAAVEMLQALETENARRLASEQERVEIGVGIHTGATESWDPGNAAWVEEVRAGSVVSVSAAVEALTRRYGVSLLMSDPTMRSLTAPLDYSMRLIDRVRFDDAGNPLAVFEVVDGDPRPLLEKKVITAPIFEDALAQYFSRNFHTKFFSSLFHLRSCRN